MYRYVIVLVSLISLALTSINLKASSLILGTIQFPSTLLTVPTVRLYCAGQIVPSTIDQKNKTISFTIPKYAQQYHFYLLIAQKVHFAPASSRYQAGTTTNTAAYLKLEPSQQYKLYSLLLIPELTSDNQLRYTWRITPAQLDPHELKIPDDTLIFCYNPAWVENIKGSNSFELPTIKISNNVVEMCGSEQAFQTMSAHIMLACLDSDTLHATQGKQHMWHNENRITIAAPTV
jgi:hypothetical protein